MEIKSEILRNEIDNWLQKQSDALRAAEAAVGRAKFAEAQIDRLLAMAGVERPQTPPELYLIKGGLDASA